MNERGCLAVVLAAGEGTRMRSARPKVLHAVGNRPMIAHVVAAAEAAGAGRLAVVVGKGAEAVTATVGALAPWAETFVQAERRGTAHAVLAARSALEDPADDVLVLCGDAPLVKPATIAAARDRLANGADLVVVGFEAADPAGYGRLIVDGGRLVAIREDREASPAERMVRLCNSGILAFRGDHVLPLLDDISDDNAKREFYLTDAVAGANARGLRVEVVVAGEEEVLGVNDRAQLARCEAVFQARARAAALAAGATLIAPETVFFSTDTALGRDVIVEPNVVFGPGVTVGEGAVIHAFSHLEGATVAAGASIGPFARLRPGADIGAGARVGNFVEVKNATVEDGAKLNHLSYIGDARVGRAANVGAGTITCNYDGGSKHFTDIGAGAFIGSNSALVAPVTIGAGAYVGSGSVITDDVPPDALAIARGRQVVKEGRAGEIRARAKQRGGEA
jgi:bifunctional UDP-N-acetylglucosamine pyrophosphorylase/glucosamine-1-phosphate N-acetyltransferase